MRKENKKMIKGIALATMLTAAIIVTQPIYTVNTFAAAIEDCDLDGYDDHTGNPVPWIGFDSTKGEAIPAGWDGHTTYKSKKAFEDAQQKNSDSDSNSSSPNNSSASGNSASSSTSKTNTSGSSASKSSTSKNTTSKSSSSKSSTSKSSTTKSSSSKNNSKTTDTPSNKSSDSVKDAQNINEETSTIATEETTTANEVKKKKSNKKKSKKSQNEEEATEVVEEEIEEENNQEIVLDTIGELEVSEADGSIIHAGSNIIVKGTGFTANVDDIEIEIHSDNVITLGSVNTSEDGNFEAEVYLPDDLEEGQHEVVVKYQGQQIATQEIKVGAKVADSFLKALTVGFSVQNKGLIPGILILAGLAVAGIITLLSGKLFGNKKK